MAPPESLMPARRLRTEAIKSPITATKAISSPQRPPSSGEKEQAERSVKEGAYSEISHGIRAPPDARKPPSSPSIVLPGLIEGAIFVRPMAFPTKEHPCH